MREEATHGQGVDQVDGVDVVDQVGRANTQDLRRPAGSRATRRTGRQG